MVNYHRDACWPIYSFKKIDDFMKNASLVSCQCLPRCDDFWVTVQLSTATFPGNGFAQSRMGGRLVKKKPDVSAANFSQYLRENVAVVNIFYREQVGMRYRTDIRYDFEDFVCMPLITKEIIGIFSTVILYLSISIAAMGGLLGLVGILHKFLNRYVSKLACPSIQGFGFSFISLIEIIYFFAIRWYFNRQLNKVHFIRNSVFSQDMNNANRMWQMVFNHHKPIQ